MIEMICTSALWALFSCGVVEEKLGYCAGAIIGMLIIVLTGVAL